MEENLGEFGESLVVHQISTMSCDIYNKSKQASKNSPGFTRQKLWWEIRPSFASPKIQAKQYFIRIFSDMYLYDWLAELEEHDNAMNNKCGLKRLITSATDQQNLKFLFL